MSHGDAAPTEAPARVLRFAVAMRGGVSLAVWIGGALAEIDRLRRGADPFAKALLGAAGFDRLEVDILTGASAGGLNAALGGAAITRGAPLSLRQVWIDSADIDALLESDMGQGSATRRSVLNGEYFLGEVCANLTGLMSQGAPNPDHAGPVEVFLAATVFGGVEVTQASDPKFSDRRREAYFHFRHLADWPSFSDFAHSPQLIDRLGRAARATASFPGAFEPVAVEPGDFAGRLHLPGTPMTSPVRLYDGGVVDNIPVSRAIRAAAASPAQETVRRWVVFLHPSPSASTAPAPTGGVPGVIAVVKDLLSGRGVETLLDDLEVLRAHNRAVEAYQLERYSLCNEVLAGVDLSRPPRLDSRSIDADRLYGLLDSPAEALGWIPIGMAPPGSPISSLDDDARYALRISFLEALVERSTAVRPYARLVRVAHLLIEWIRWVERFTVAPSSEWRRIVYDVMLVAQLVDGALDLRFLTTGADSRIDDLVAGLDAVGASPDLRHLAGALAAAHPTGTGWQPLRDRLDAAGREALDALASGKLPTAGGLLSQDREPLDEALLDHLATIGGELAARSAAIGSAASRPESRSPDPSLFTLLRAALGQEPTGARARSALLAVD